MSTIVPESVDAVRKFAVNSLFGDMMLSLVKDLGEADEEDTESEDLVDKHLAGVLTKSIMKFGP
jgi:hypothetical protein